MRIVPLLALPLLLAACGPDNGGYDTAPPADAPAASSSGAPPTPANAPAPDAPSSATWPGDFNLIGTEPFWSLEIRPTGLTLTRPDAPALTAPNPGPVAQGEQGVWTTPAMTARLVKAECSDGMSDRVYPYTATVTLADGAGLKGCGAPPKDFSEARP